MSLVEQVRQAGVIGCGGAGFPTHVKLDAQADIVIANGAECEPLLNSDQRVMEHYGSELIDGLTRVMNCVGASRGVIAVKKSYIPAIKALSQLIEKVPGVELFQLDNFYPAGDEQTLLTEITGKIVPEGGIPLNVNALVSNVLTLVQIARAAQGQAVIAREVTLVGAIKKPQVVCVPIGTPIAELLDWALAERPISEMAIIDGGPQMGRLVGLDQTVNKTTCGLVFLPQDHPVIAAKTIPMASIIRRSVAACCQCRYCTDVCPRYLQGHRIEPHLMMRTLAYKTSTPPAAVTGAFLCCQCGLCDYACPMDLSPKRAFAEILSELRSAGMKNPHHAAPVQANEFRQYRKIGKDRLIRRYGLTPFDSHSLALSRFPDPDKVRISLKQALGVPPKPIVAVGDTVRKGEAIAQIPSGQLSAALHASIPGTVLEVNDSYITIQGEK